MFFIPYLILFISRWMNDWLLLYPFISPFTIKRLDLFSFITLALYFLNFIFCLLYYKIVFYLILRFWKGVLLKLSYVSYLLPSSYSVFSWLRWIILFSWASNFSCRIYEKVVCYGCIGWCICVFYWYFVEWLLWWNGVW